MKSGDRDILRTEVERLEQEIKRGMFGSIGFEFVVRDGEIQRVIRHDDRTVKAADVRKAGDAETRRDPWVAL